MRRRNTKTTMTLISIMVGPLLLLGQSVAYAGTNTSGGSQSGAKVEGEYHLTQDEYDEANRLNFTSTNVDSDINGWSITTKKFTDSSSERDGARAVDVEAWGYTVANGETVDVEVTQWVKEENSIGKRDVYWSQSKGRQAKAMPDHAWRVSYPEPIPELPGFYRHTFTMINDDSVYELKVDGLTFEYFPLPQELPLSSITFTAPGTDLPTLPPGHVWSTDIVTEGQLIGGYIYFKYDLYNLEGTTIVCNAWGGHPITTPIPAVTEWGLIVMVLMGMAAGTIMFRKWREQTAHA